MFETQKIVKNIMRDVETSSAPNKRVREARTLIEEANEVEFVTQNSNINTTISKRNLAISFFRLDPSYG